MAACPWFGRAVSSTLAAPNLRRHASRRASAEAMNSPKSMGRYFVQTPPGERKSGIPDSVLIPAPVNTTACRASTKYRPSRSAPAVAIN